MKIGFKTNQSDVEWSELLEAWEVADGLTAIDSGWLWDHFVDVPRPLQSHPPSPAGSHEAFTLAAALGARTTRLQFGHLVLGNTYRHPALVAKMGATLDHIVGGRFVLGLGAAWHEPEHAMYGWPFPPIGERMTALDAALRVIKGMWASPDGFSASAGPYTLVDAICKPAPLTPGGPPVWVGTHGKQRGLRILAKHADGWTTTSDGWTPSNAGSFPTFIEERDALFRHCESLGRAPESIEISVRIFTDTERGFIPASELVAEASAYAKAGARHIVFAVRGDEGQRLPSVVERLAREVAEPIHQSFDQPAKSI